MSTTGLQLNDEGASQGEEAQTEASSATEESSSANLSLNVVFDILRNKRRRLVLQAIEERDGSTTLSELAEHIGGLENEKSPHALNAQERKRVYVGLYQCHLPKMHDAGAIEFDKNRGTVERGPMADIYHVYLEREPHVEKPWPKYYGGTACLSSVGLVVGSVLTGSATLALLAALTLVAIVATYHRTCYQTP